MFRIISQKGNHLQVKMTNFDPVHTFSCGQCFRWNQDHDGVWSGIVSGTGLKLLWDGDICTFGDTDEQELMEKWVPYFDLDTDYTEIKRELAMKDPCLEKAISYGHGIRLLRQNFTEVLFSFILSQNNNIPRIKQIIESLCIHFGNPVQGDFKQNAFPEISALANASLEDLNRCRGGYRCRYLLETAKIFSTPPLKSMDIQKLPTDEIRKFLLSIPGIGEKVADCILLYSGLDRSVFPIDRWIKRVMEKLYFKKETDVQSIRAFSKEYFGGLAGIAQQYLFYYARE